MAGEMLKTAGLAVMAVSAAVILRRDRPELAVAVSAAAGILLLYNGMEYAAAVRSAAEGLMSRYGVELESLSASLRIVGIAYIAQFAADLSRDSGEHAIASKVELAGRLMMLAVAFPLISSVMGAIGGLMGQ